MVRVKYQFIIAGFVWIILAIVSFVNGKNLQGLIFISVSSVFLVPAFFVPSFLKLIDRFFRRVINACINIVAGTLLTIVYIFVMTPLGVLYRIMGLIHITMKPDKKLKTYWIARKREPITPSRYRRSF